MLAAAVTFTAGAAAVLAITHFTGKSLRLVRADTVQTFQGTDQLVALSFEKTPPLPYVVLLRDGQAAAVWKADGAKVVAREVVEAAAKTQGSGGVTFHANLTPVGEINGVSVTRATSFVASSIRGEGLYSIGALSQKSGRFSLSLMQHSSGKKRHFSLIRVY